MGNGQVKNNKTKYKIAALTAAFVVALGGAGVCIGGMAKAMSVKDNIESQYKETEAYQEYLDEQHIDIQARVDNNEITEEQAMKERGALSSWEAVQEAILKDNPDNIQYQDMLKEYNKFNTMRLVGLMTVNTFNIAFSTYNIVRLIKLGREQKKQHQEIKEKIKDFEENIKIETERIEGKQLEDYSEELED